MPKKSLTGYDSSGQRVINVGDGSAASDAVNKGQLDNAIRGLDWKQEVVAASTGNVTLSAPGTTLDGVTLAVNDRIMLKDQTAPAENGIYIWTASGSSLTRALDADTWAELTGSTVTIQRGTVNADRVYRVNSDDGGSLGTTAVTWAQVGGGSAKTAGNGLVETGSTYDVGAGTGINVGADAVSIDTSVVARKASFDCATAQTQTFTHNLNTRDVQVVVRQASNNELVEADIINDTLNTVQVNFGSATSAGQYRVTVIG